MALLYTSKFSKTSFSPIISMKQLFERKNNALMFMLLFIHLLFLLCCKLCMKRNLTYAYLIPARLTYS